jgi:hypothetical protein
MSIDIKDFVPQLPDAQVDIQVRVSARLNVTTARQKVSGGVFPVHDN